LRATGIGKTLYTQERTIIKKTYLKEFDAAFNIEKQATIKGSEEISCNSGWILSLEELDAWLDMIHSDEVYEIIAGKLYPIGFTSVDSPEISDDPAPAYNFDFKYKRNAQETSYMVGSWGPIIT
jgi:hypothetical protein